MSWSNVTARACAEFVTIVGDPTPLQLQDTLYHSKNATRRWIHTRRRETIEALLRRVAGGGVERSMEIGPGSGLYLPLLASLSEEVYVSDIDPSFLERAREILAGNDRAHFVVDDITKSSLPTATFDLILCTEVLEHIPEWRAALASMARLLRPGGTLVLSTPQPRSPLEVMGKVAFRPGVIRVVRAIYREPILETGHISLVSARRLDQQLAASGLRVQERQWTGTYLPLIAEFGGERALRLEMALETRLRASPLRGLLWTQYVVARR
ncbi:MAG TPA: class I SAM-dependent methyltransferase [Acidimicrobiales bacterium]|jgi:SAM-dependent methyltransferase|nr:class I SAM-dependent methyltransferase [Acidimicrobiales bacterium]